MATALAISREPEEEAPRSPDISDLSFIQKRSKAGSHRRLFWVVKPTGRYTKDCETGARFGLEYLDYITADAMCPGGLLAWIVSDMPRELTGIEIGFLGTIGDAAVAGKQRAFRIAAYHARCERERKAKGGR